MSDFASWTVDRRIGATRDPSAPIIRLNGARRSGWLPAGDASAALATGFALALGVSTMLAVGLARPAPLIVATGAIYLAIAAVIVLFLPRHRHARFGLANLITTIRVGMTAALAGVLSAALIGQGDMSGLMSGWMLAGVAVVCLALDGVDGWAARRQGTASSFGARYDMEIDAALALVLSGLAMASGRVGALVLGLGLARYVFVAACVMYPRLRAPLTPAFRRKLVCVLQIGILCALVAPVLGPPIANPLAAFGLAALAYSFGTDISLLLRKSGKAGTAMPGSAPASEVRP